MLTMLNLIGLLLRLLLGMFEESKSLSQVDLDGLPSLPCD